MLLSRFHCKRNKLVLSRFVKNTALYFANKISDFLLLAGFFGGVHSALCADHYQSYE